MCAVSGEYSQSDTEEYFHFFDSGQSRQWSRPATVCIPWLIDHHHHHTAFIMRLLQTKTYWISNASLKDKFLTCSWKHVYWKWCIVQQGDSCMTHIVQCTHTHTHTHTHTCVPDSLPAAAVSVTLVACLRILPRPTTRSYACSMFNSASSDSSSSTWQQFHIISTKCRHFQFGWSYRAAVTQISKINLKNLRQAYTLSYPTSEILLSHVV